MRTPKDSTVPKYSKINDRHRERISSSKTKFPIIQNLPPTSRTEQIDNNQIQKEGEKSRKNIIESKKSYADIVNQNMRHPYKTNDSTKSITKKQLYPPQKKKQIT